MPNRGVKPVPDAIRIARGTYRKDRHGTPETKVEPRLIDDIAVPKGLGKAGKSRWSQWVETFRLDKMLEQRHLDSLEMYCRAWDRMEECEALAKKDGEYITSESGAMSRHPALIEAHACRESIRRYIIEFGGTPSSATNVRRQVAPKTAGVPNRQRDLG